jgi:hypothetical protein
MSSNIKETTSGTQSPPLEATGSEKPMGVCSIDGTKPTYALDREQRKGDSSFLNLSWPSLLTQRIPGRVLQPFGEGYQRSSFDLK